MASTVVLYDVFEVHNGLSTAGVYNNMVSNMNNRIPILTPSTVQRAPAVVISRRGVEEWLAGIDENDPFRSEIDVRSSCIVRATVETGPPLPESDVSTAGRQGSSQDGSSQSTQSPPLKPRPLRALVEHAKSFGRGKVGPPKEERKAVGDEDQGSNPAAKVDNQGGPNASETAGAQAGPEADSSTADTKRRNRALGRSASARTQPTWHRTYTTTKRTRSQSWSQSLFNRMSRLADKVPGSSGVDSNQCAVAHEGGAQVGAGAGLDIIDVHLDAVDANSDSDTKPCSHAVADTLQVVARGCCECTSGLDCDNDNHHLPTGRRNRNTPDPSDPSESSSLISSDSNDSQNSASHTPATPSKAL